jgi:DNA-binding IclR family transcriptional regulator
MTLREGVLATLAPGEWFTVKAILAANRTFARARVHRMLALLEREGKVERDHRIAATLWRLKP